MVSLSLNLNVSSAVILNCEKNLYDLPGPKMENVAAMRHSK